MRLKSNILIHYQIRTRKQKVLKCLEELKQIVKSPMKNIMVYIEELSVHATSHLYTLENKSSISHHVWNSAHSADNSLVKLVRHVMEWGPLDDYKSLLKQGRRSKP